MFCGICPFIIKHHGKIKYTKFIISAIRHKGIKSSSPTIKVCATLSNSSASFARKNVDVLKKDDYLKQTFEDSNSNSLDKSNLSENDCPVSSKSESDYPTSSVSQSGRIPVTLNPLTQPDVTLEVLKTISSNEEKETVKLLNVIKPSDLEWQKQVLDKTTLLSHYKSLAKYRLTGLVVLSTLAGYGMAPGVFEPTTLLCALVGTAFMSSAANTVNQFLEIPYDSQMNRTKNRVLVRGLITPLHAFGFAVCCATLGLSTLCLGTTALTTVLGATNLILYTCVYTPLKRCSILNTWVGSVVGAIPPLIGWSAATGTLNASALLMGAILYSWQFPHFNALSWNLRHDYSKAGYRMTCVIDPALCRRTALRHSIAILVLCSAAPILDLTTWTFAFDSFPLNVYLVYCAWKFYEKADSQSSRKLFRLSLIHLPALMFLMLIGKKYAVEEKKKDEINL